MPSGAAIIDVPTAITGFYGQNLPYPGFANESEFIAFTTLIVIWSAALYVTFKQKDWLWVSPLPASVTTLRPSRTPSGQAHALRSPLRSRRSRPRGHATLRSPSCGPAPAARNTQPDRSGCRLVTR